MRQFNIRILYLLLMVVTGAVTVMFQGCKSDDRTQLDLAGKLMLENPDSAHTITQNFEISHFNSAENKALCALRKMQSDYFSEQPTWANDTLVKTAIDYYRNHPEKPESAQAYYMAGLFNNEVGNKLQSIEYLSEAIISAEQHNNPLIAARAHGELAEINYSYNRLNNSLYHAKRNYELINKYDGPRSSGYKDYAISQVVWAYYNMQAIDSTLHYLELALKRFDPDRNPDKYYYMLQLKAKVLTLENKNNEALVIFDKINREHKESLNELALLYIGLLNLKNGNIKKAEEYDSMLSSQAGRSKILSANIAAQKGNYRKAFDLMANEYLSEENQVHKISSDTTISDMDIISKLRIQRMFKEKEKEHSSKIIRDLLIIGIICTVLLILLILWIIKRIAAKRMSETIRKLSKDLDNYKKDHESNLQELDAYKEKLTIARKEVKILKESLSNNSDSGISEHEDTQLENSALKDVEKHAPVITYTEDKDVTLETFQNKEFLRKLEEIADIKTDGLLSRFKQTTRTAKFFHMTESLIFVILDYKPREVAKYLQTDSSKISRYRSQLKNRLKDEDPELFNLFIKYIRNWN